MRKISFVVFTLAVLTTLNSCKKEGCTDLTATNYDTEAKKDNGTCVYSSTTSTVPTTYSFERNGTSSVSFSGQTQRMDMLTEMVTYLKTANTPGTALDLQKLMDMFSNENSPFSSAELNNTTKQLRNKTAGGDLSFLVSFDAQLKRAVESSKLTQAGKYEAKDSVAGVSQSGTKAYLFDENGAEMTQFFEKGLMGAVFYYQIGHVYFGDEKMSADNVSIVDGKNYTQLEHHWDEAFGYFTDAVDFPTNGTDRYWGKYCNARDAELGCNKTIITAFKTGRLAIVNKDLPLRDAQIQIINKELEKVIIATAINYLNEAKGNFANNTLRNHEISEATQFIECIRYGKNPAFSNSELGNILSNIGVNYYHITGEKINETIDVLTQKLNTL